jgi:antitoxin ParD1/3/4
MSHIELPDEVVRLVEAQVTAGRAGSIADVVRAGVAALEREQQRYETKIAKLRAAIDEGDASGVFDGDPFAAVRAKYGLPTTPR